MTWESELDELHHREQLAQAMGGSEKIAKHHTQGRLTVRERIKLLLDTDTFHETGALAGTAEYNDEGQLANSLQIPLVRLVDGTGRRWR